MSKQFKVYLRLRAKNSEDVKTFEVSRYAFNAVLFRWVYLRNLMKNGINFIMTFDRQANEIEAVCDFLQKDHQLTMLARDVAQIMVEYETSESESVKRPEKRKNKETIESRLEKIEKKMKINEDREKIYHFDYKENSLDCNFPVIQEGESKHHFNLRKVRQRWVCENCVDDITLFCNHRNVHIIWKSDDEILCSLSTLSLPRK